MLDSLFVMSKRIRDMPQAICHSLYILHGACSYTINLCRALFTAKLFHNSVYSRLDGVNLLFHYGTCKRDAAAYVCGLLRFPSNDLGHTGCEIDATRDRVESCAQDLSRAGMLLPERY